MSLDNGCPAYHRKIELTGRTLRYVKTFEIRTLSVPAAKAPEVRHFSRAVLGDESRPAARIIPTDASDTLRGGR